MTECKFKRFVKMIGIIRITLLPVYLFFSYINCSSQYQDIYTVDTLDLLEQKARSFGKDDLVIFDVDGVLSYHPQGVLSGANKESIRIRKKLFGPGSRFSELPQSKQKYLKSLEMLHAKLLPVDQKNSKIIQALQKKGVKVIALTALNTGQMGAIEYLEDWRINKLNDIDIDFSSAFKLNESLMLHPVTSSQSSLYKQALAKKGVVFCSLYPKGATLGAFFDAIKWLPKRIIFVDDIMRNIKSVAALCKQRAIDFTGFHYVKIKQINHAINEQLMTFQVNYLIDHEIWLDDEKAEKLINKISATLP